jgi:hypothetical protein
MAKKIKEITAETLANDWDDEESETQDLAPEIPFPTPATGSSDQPPESQETGETIEQYLERTNQEQVVQVTEFYKITKENDKVVKTEITASPEVKIITKRKDQNG